MSDRAFIRLVGRNGTTLYSGRTTVNIGYGDDFPVRTADGGEVRLHQRITFPDRIYKLARAQHVGSVEHLACNLEYPGSETPFLQGIRDQR